MSLKRICLLLLAFSTISLHGHAAGGHNHDHDLPTGGVEGMPELPTVVQFVENQGQWEAPVLYKAGVPGGWVYFEKGRLTYQLADLNGLHDAYFHTEKDRRQATVRGHVFQMDLAGADFNGVEAGDQQEAYHNYFLGDDPSRWAGQVPLFGQLRYRQVYPGIDLVYYGHEQSIKYDFELAAGADPAAIAMDYTGLEDLRIDKEGKLVMQTSVGNVVEMAPYAYQKIGGRQVEVACAFILENNRVGFQLGDYDFQYPLVIDPSLIFASYTGSTADNFGYTATYDDAGNLYGGGIAFGLGYPTTPGAFQTTFGGGTGVPFGNGFDISITKFNPLGTAIIWSTFLGGSDNEQPHSLVTTSAEELVVYGRTFSTNYPVTAGAFQTTNAGGSDIVVTKFDNTGGLLLGSTYVGGNNNDGLNIHISFFQNSLYFNYGDDARGEVIVDDNDNIYVASCTQSQNFPVSAGGFQQAFGGGTQDGCVFRLSPNLQAMTWGTYLGGSANDASYGIRRDGSGNVFVAGGTESANFPVTAAGWNPVPQGGIDGYLSKLDPAGATLLAGTFLGTGQYDQAYFVEVDENDDVFVVGQTLGAFPVSQGVYSNPGGKQFIAQLDNNLSAPGFSTVFGSGGATIDISPTAFLVDRCGFIYVAGWGGTVNFTGNTNGLPLTADAFQSTTDGSDIYLFVLAPGGAALNYATYFGGAVSSEHVDGGTSRFNPNLEVYHAVCAGCGGNSDFPTSPGVVSNTNNSSNCNLGVFKFALEPQDVLAAYTSVAFDSCAPFPVDFTNNSVGGVFYVWDYGDGTRDTIFDGSHTYQFPGTYTVQLIAVDSNSCNISDTASALVTVYGNPVVLVSGADTVCSGTTVQLDAQGGQTFDWSPGIFLSDSTISNPTATPQQDITYTVIVTDSNGCVDTAAVYIDVTIFSADAGPPVSFCEGQGGAQLQAGPVNDGVAPYYYTWWCDSTNTFCGLDSTFDDDPLALPTDTTVYYLQVTDATGCLSEIDSTVVYVLPVPIADAGPDQAICQPPAPGALLNGSFSNAPGPFDFYWFPGAGLNDSTLLNPFARPDTTTIYTLIGISANGCSSAPTTLDTVSTVTVTVHPLPIADAGPDIDICATDTTQFQGLGYNAGPDYDFEWSPTTGLSNPNIASPFANPPITTEYILTVWSNGCPSYGDTMRLTVHTLPTPSAGNIGEICLGDSAQLDAFADGDSSASYTYQWMPIGGLNDPTAENPLASPDTTTWYYLVATSSWGCESAGDSVLVNVLATPQAEAGNDTTICGGDTLDLQGGYFYTTTGEANPNDVYFNWSPSGLLSDPSTAGPQAWPSSSTYFFLDVTHVNCVTRDSVLVTVVPEVLAVLAADTTVICGGDSVQLSASGGLGGVSFQWLPATGLSDPNSPNPMAAPSETTTYVVSLDEGGCRDTAGVTIEVIPSPMAAYLSSAVSGCVPLRVNFQDVSTDAANWVWNFGDGSSVSNVANPEHTYEQPGSYVVSLLAVNAGGCSDEVRSIVVEVGDTARAEFAADPGWPAELPLPGADVGFTDLSANAQTWWWDFGDGLVSNQPNPNHVYEQPGEYFVTLQVESADGCLSRVQHGPFIVAMPDLFIPNVFTPNDDGINDVFRVEYGGSQPFQIQIYDRWGVLLYSNTNKLGTWNGQTEEGLAAPEGTYYYRVDVGDREFAGDVTLVR